MDFQSWSLVMLASFCYCASARRGIEPECTRFEYDVQLLERMVRFEHTIKLMEERLKNCLQGWDAKETKLMSEIKTLSESLKTELSKNIADTKKEININVNQTIDSINGQWKRPTVYFHYYKAATEYLSNGDTMRFTIKKTDTHNAYDNTTGCFTVPVQGVYIFGMQLAMETGKTIRVDILVNGSRYTYADLNKSTDNKSTNMNIGILLKSKDLVCVKAGPGTNSGDLIYNPNDPFNFLYGTLVG